MNTDSIFCIGKTHKICQDYTASEVLSPHSEDSTAYAVVSDGCSSSPDTDFGARILTRVCAETLSNFRELDYKTLITKASDMSTSLNLNSRALDATLLCVDFDGFYGDYIIHMFGDGTAVKLRKDGVIEVINIEYISGAPFYLNYFCNKERKNSFIEKFGLKKIITKFSIYPNGLVFESSSKEDNDETYFTENNSSENYKAVGVLSDGISSFYELVNTGTSKIQQPVALENVLSMLLDFKGFQGEFVQRRMQKFNKDCEKLNWNHADDLSLSMIYFGD